MIDPAGLQRDLADGEKMVGQADDLTLAQLKKQCLALGLFH